MSDRPIIAIVEDDDSIATGLALNLRINGYEPLVFHDGEQALDALSRTEVSLILLDINLPTTDGIQVLGSLREQGDHTPVIVLSAREGEYDKVAALRLGADDYVTKPFGVAELFARVDAVLRRAGKATPVPAATPYCFSDVEIDIATRSVNRGGKEVKLTHLEFELLSFFVAHASRVFSRDELLREVWGQRSGSTRTVDNFVGQLRSKLEADPDSPQHFITVRGSGYRFDP